MDDLNEEDEVRFLKWQLEFLENFVIQKGWDWRNDYNIISLWIMTNGSLLRNIYYKLKDVENESLLKDE